MNECMEDRGPDAEGVYASGPALLAHRRLSILDLSEAGRQPMANDDGTVHVVFNGEIYNYRELRERVDQYSFRSETDTEVLLHLYEEYGTDCLQYLRGMFAFAIWDESDERLFLARDRLGQKPLFYRDGEDGFWFASSIKAILADDEVTARPDLPAIRSYLNYQYVPTPKTGFQGIEQLSPGEYMIVSESGTTRDRYWDLSYRDQFSKSPSWIMSELRDRLYEATRLRMRSDVPVGVFLSGGIDSSVVAALMDDVADDPIGTYSIGFDEEAYDELEFAREVADVYGTDHHEYTVTPNSMEVLPEIVEQYEMPFGDPSALPTYYVSQVASEDITVALTGDAGDENFAGYDRYTYDRVVSAANSIPQFVRTPVATALDALPDGVGNQKHIHYAKRALEIADRDPADRYALFICHATGEQAERVWSGPVPDDELAQFREAFAHSDGPTRLDRIMHVDLQTYMPDNLLVKVDRASMAHSLEVRSPFLDHEVVEFAARIPAKYKWRRGNGKWILKRAFEDVLPEKVITRSKQGFGVPINEWFRGELREFARENLDRLGERTAFDAGGLRQTFDEHVDGRVDHGYRLWDLVLLEQWYERFVDG
ncbi:asparagine synthase (glutamine-hydrolyzing) [Halorussus gelatinilyticus]|uniref:Putative asparagine synthetase [glutamine-hydrolyzing] n=2 Tax=Halorussus gelatinilyticus TaxID=2937524 RepID=A0A8U0IJR6_9EURY|nr:asparagine synthase (glutamine-hydrolyzing) [Halorussus gelatinilyticus]